MDKLNLDKIYNLRKETQIHPSKMIGEIVRYYFNQSDFFCFLGNNGLSNELRVSIDNFPRQRQAYSSNLPILSHTDLEFDLKRIGVELEKLSA
jgi:hypothetical protein